MINIELSPVFNDMYKIEEVLSTGYYGSVYKAWHKRLQIYVVLKELVHSEYSCVQSRRNEAEALKNIKSKHLPLVYDFFDDGCRSFTVMEFIDGESFMSLLKKKIKFNQHRVMRWYFELASVLEDLHDLNICHGDIKPSNIMLMPNGKACLIDFNVAIIKGNDQSFISRSRGYASPEQYKLFVHYKNRNDYINGCIDWKLSDIHNLGAAMYHILTGERMKYDKSGRVLQENFSRKVSKSGNRSLLSPCHFIIERSTHPNSGNRFTSAAALRRTIQSIVS